jgi:DNA-binding transcriptional ArsR family regulator
MTTSVNWEKVARAKVHPTQVAVLDLLQMDLGRVLSPNEMSFELRESLGNVSYHAKELEKAGLIALADTAQRRGALEHYYRLAEQKPGRSA